MASIQLIKCPATVDSVIQDKWYLPLELVWISNYLRQHGHDVEILDGQHLSSDEIISRIDAQIVGINFHIHSSASLDEIVSAAKRKNAFVVVGGQAATQLSRQLVMTNAEIDVVIPFDGEEALRQIGDAFDAGKNPYTGTDNIVYRSKNELIQHPVRFVPVSEIPFMDRRVPGIDIEQYISKFKSTNTFKGFEGQRATNAHTKKGCPRSCSFCGRTDKEYRPRTPQQAFDEYRYLVDEFGVDFVFDHSDTWALDASWLREYRRVYEKEGGLEAKFSYFVDLRDVKPETIEHLKIIGVSTVETGIESGDASVLKENLKASTQERIIERVEMLAEAGIRVEASHVLGLLGETRESVQNTVGLSKLLREKHPDVRNYFNVIIPLPGTFIWKNFMTAPEMEEKYANAYDFNLEDLRKDFIEEYCDLGEDGYDYLLHSRNQALKDNNLSIMDYAR